MTRFSIAIDDRLDTLSAEARTRLAEIPGQPTPAETVAEMFREMVRAFGGGYHPDTDSYESYPTGYNAPVVGALEDLADEFGLDLYDLALEASR